MHVPLFIMQLSCSIQIEFVGECAEDGGGPRREFWTLLAREVASTMFTGFDYRLAPIHDVVGLQVCVTSVFSCCTQCI